MMIFRTNIRREGFFMYRLLLISAVVVLSGFVLIPSGAKAQEAEPTVGLIGTVVGDTLFVDRDKVVSAALTHNEMLAASGAMVDAAEADALGAWRGFLPQVQLGEFFMRSDDALSSFGFKLQNRSVTAMDFNPALLNNPGETNNFISRIQLLQPIFNGGMGINGKQAADAASRAAGHQHQRATETIRYNAIQAFEGLALAKAYEGVMAAAVASAQGHVRQAQSMVDNEMATEADLLQARVFLSTLQQKLIEVRNMMAMAGENIKLLTAIQTDLPLAANPEGPSFEGAAQYAMDPAAIAGRSDLQASRENARAASEMVGVATGAILPHVNLSLQRDWYDMENLFGGDASSWTLGVYATMGFGVENLGQIKKAKAHSRAAEYKADFETRQARVQATQALLNVRAAHEKVLVAQSAVTAAREGLRIVTNQYREGLAGMVDLLDTQAAATLAEGNLVQARHDYFVGLANLEFSGAVPVEPSSASDNNPDTAAVSGQ